jgi:CBS domain-containing protein
MPRTRDYYKTDVATAALDATVVELVELMAQLAIGCVVIVDAAERPVGIVTDRDVTCRVIAKRADPETTTAGAIMSKPLATASPTDPIEVVVERMRAAGVRRLPVVRDDQLTGLVAFDDLLVEFARELDELAESAHREVETSRRRGRRERRREDLEQSLAELRGSFERAGREAADFVSREFEAVRERLQRGRKS